MRERSTWNLQEIARQAAKKQAAEVAGDVYSMNQDHPQPAMDEYVIGDPSDFAEDVHSPNTWEEEYSDGQTARDEIGMPELRKDTFNHAEKTASDRVRLKKAELCVAVAKLMLRGGKVAGIDAIEDQAFALMYVPDQELINTHRRLAAEQGEEDVEEEADDDDGFAEDDDSDEGQDKQAGEIPPQFKENIEKMKAKSKGGDDDDADDDDDDDGQQKQASRRMLAKKKNSEQQSKDDGGDQNAKSNDNWPTKSANGQQQVAQMQQMMAQLQQLIQQAQGQQLPGEQQALGQQVPGQQQALGQQFPSQEPVLGGDDDLEQLLADDSCGPLAEGDIEMDPAPLDTENVVLAGEDEILRTLFAQDEQVEEDDQGQAQVQQKQGSRRTASTRTVGTRPRAGVAKLGGSTSKTASDAVVDKLSSLWQSAPDVRDAFGLK